MKKRILIAGLLLAMLSSVALAGEPDGAELVAKAWDYMRGKTSVCTVTMTVHRADWERTSVIKAWTRGREDSIFQIISPKKDRGNGTLKTGRDMWTFNPKINRVVKIPPSMMSQSWMGSDFSNNDLSKADTILNDYTHEIVETRTMDGVTVYKVKSLPKPDAAVIWGMQTLLIREDGIIIEQAFYDEDMEAVKIMTASDIKAFGGKFFPATWTMRPIGAGSMDAGSKEEYTRLEYRDLAFDLPLEQSLFTMNALKQPLR